MDVIHELLATTAAAEKLGARAILIEEAQQLLNNRYVILRTPGAVAGDGNALRVASSSAGPTAAERSRLSSSVPTSRRRG